MTEKTPLNKTKSELIKKINYIAMSPSMTKEDREELNKDLEKIVEKYKKLTSI